MPLPFASSLCEVSSFKLGAAAIELLILLVSASCEISLAVDVEQLTFLTKAGVGRGMLVG